MPSKTKMKNAAIAARSAALPKIPNELIDQFVTGPMPGEAVNAASMAFKKALIERAMGAELGHHLGYPAGAAKPEAGTNQRNGKSAKTVQTGEGPVRIEVPRDRDGSFEPILIPKHERRFTGFDETIIALYARGMTMREIQGFLRETYGTDVSAEFISSVTEAVMAEVTTWQARPLEPMYPVVFFDALRVKIKEDAVVRNKAIYLALGVLPDGTRDILGLWIEGTEGAKFWMKVFNDLKTRGINDILIAVTDGLKGMPEALGAVFPATTLQTCIVHLIRNSLDYASWKDRKPLAAAIKPIYTAANAEAAQGELDAFEQGALGPEVPRGSGLLAQGLEPRDSVLRIPATDQAGDLHDQRHREHQCKAAQDHQVTGALPQRRCGQQADLAGLAKHHDRMGPCGAQLEGGNESVRDPLRRSFRKEGRLRCTTDLPTASVVRRKRRPPPWTSLSASNTKIQTAPPAAAQCKDHAATPSTCSRTHFARTAKPKHR
jgi:putative transposase